MMRLAVALLLFTALPAHAQVTIPGLTTALSLTVSPHYPSPGEVVELSLQSFLHDLSGSFVTWFQDGAVIAEGEGLSSVSVQAPQAGGRSTVEAAVTSPSGEASASVQLSPVSIDLAWEAESFTPPFYKGRALVSSGDTIRLHALPHFVRANGTRVPASEITFTWRRDGRVLLSQSGRGKSSLVTEGPTLYGSQAVSVEAVSADGALAGEATARIADSAPELRLYEHHPLFGILYGQALGVSTFIPDAEMTFIAVPYFAPVRSPLEQELEYAWRINATPVATDGAHADEVTINAASSTGLAHIELALGHTSNFFFGVSGTWNVTLNSRQGAVSGFDPFR